MDKESTPGNLQEQPLGVRDASSSSKARMPELSDRLHLLCGLGGVNQALCVLFSMTLKLKLHNTVERQIWEQLKLGVDRQRELQR